MKILRRTWRLTAVIIMLCLSSMTVFATGEQSTDNSLATLGIQNAEVSPEFYYSTTEYDVKVPAGTKELTLDPQTSDVNAEIVSIIGNELDNGNGTVTITVAAENGSQAVYTLHVTADETKAAATEPAAQTENITESAAATESKPAAQTEKKQDDALKSLNTQLNSVNEKLSLSMRILYGMIAFTVLLLFIIINLLLRNKDLKDDLREAENALDLNTNEFARKEKTLSSDYYYAPVPEMQPESADAPGVALEKVQETTEQVFGNAQAQVKPNAEVSKEIVQPQAARSRGKEAARQENARARKKKPQQPGTDRPKDKEKARTQAGSQDQQKQPQENSQGQQPQGKSQAQPRRQPQEKSEGQPRQQPQEKSETQPRRQGQGQPGQPPQGKRQARPPQRQVKNQNQADGQNWEMPVTEAQNAVQNQAAPKKRASKKQPAGKSKPQVSKQPANENPEDIDVTMIDL